MVAEDDAPAPDPDEAAADEGPEPALPDVLQRLRARLDRLGRPVKAFEMEMEAGGTEPALEVRHGDHVVWAVARQGTADLICPMHLTEAEVGRLASLEDEDLDVVVMELERALLDGRCWYDLYFDDDGVLTGFTVAQNLVVEPEDPTGLQRLADGLQEVVTLSLRGAWALGLLGGAGPAEPERGGGPSGPHPGMYG